MDGWYVSKLLLESSKIRSSLLSENDFSTLDDFSEPDISIDINLDSDLYSDLLTVEMKINELFTRKLISELELNIIKTIMNGEKYYELESKFNISRVTISKIFNEVCERVAFALGEHFTDDGYLNYLKNKYHLTEEELVIAELYIKRKFKIKK